MQQLYAKVIDQEQHQGVTILNEKNELIGDIFATTISGCDDKNTYGFKHKSGTEILLGLQNRRFKDLNVAKYTVEYQGVHYTLKERKLRNFMNFHVEGVVDNTTYIFKDDKEVTLTMYRDDDLLGTMNDHKIYTGETSDVETCLIILMYFMYKLYKREDYHLAKLLHRNW
ncbi:hypothetical protein LNK15_07515 [Jeotgalicoccus huakuii]|nr:hypothetical protein [Jeotgalicoccus huakuii]